MDTHVWFSRLNNGVSLLSEKTLTPSSIIVCKQTKYRQFRMFDNFDDFYEAYEEEPDKHWYEIMTGNRSVKPFFDIDLKESEFDFIEFKEIFVKTVERVAKELSIRLSGITFYSSHSQTYKSMHIVITDSYLSNNSENKFLCLFIIERLPVEYSKYFDKCVYTANRQMRLLGSTKYGSTRVKIRDYHTGDISFNGIFNRETLRKSLISVPSGNYIDLSSKIIRAVKDNRRIELSQLTIQQIMSDVNDFDSGTFDFLKTVEGLVLLKRNKASYCQICLREHEHENAYAFTMKGDTYFSCRRGDEYTKITNDTNDVYVSYTKKKFNMSSIINEIMNCEVEIEDYIRERYYQVTLPK